jgi:hypothetical protein
LLVTFLVSGYRSIIRAVRRQEPAASLRLAFFVVACVANCTEAGFKMMHPMWIAMLLVAAARPASSFLPKRVPISREASKKSSATPDFANAFASK